MHVGRLAWLSPAPLREALLVKSARGGAGDVWVACRADAEAVQRLLACLTQALQHFQPGPGSHGTPGQLAMSVGTAGSCLNRICARALMLSLQGWCVLGALVCWSHAAVLVSVEVLAGQTLCDCLQAVMGNLCGILELCACAGATDRSFRPQSIGLPVRKLMRVLVLVCIAL